jgi:hypothetical protein
MLPATREIVFGKPRASASLLWRPFGRASRLTRETILTAFDVGCCTSVGLRLRIFSILVSFDVRGICISHRATGTLRHQVFAIDCRKITLRLPRPFEQSMTA